ncbi:hypothetical protein [Actinotalea sp. Marseille-Q4924]|uniref:hypothetical protein n=1 Tax=Actinotalea sp. Marseille-Q4924 TaxID=2866571 RepID=UPI001CE42EFA|nr:hypothetical protein [Actinotalea sp. Marseille-Q4924]
MATFSSLTRHHVLQAMEDHDARGAEDFLAAYGFEPQTEYALVHEERRYDLRAVVGVAHRFATGRLATAEEFASSMDGVVGILRRRGFEVTEPASVMRAAARKSVRAPARGTRAPATRAASTRTTSRAREERPPAICPTCSMALPGTGICDDCG